MELTKIKWLVSIIIVAVLIVGGIMFGLMRSDSEESLTMIVSAGGSGRTFQAAAEKFTEKTGINVRVVSYPYAETREKQLLELSNNTGNLDIVMIDGQIWLSELHQYIDPIDYEQSEMDSLIPSMVDLFRYGPDRTLYALPVRIGGWVLMYRKDLFDAEGLEPPKTWDDFLTTAQQLTKGDVYGFAPAMKQGNYLTVQWIPFLRSFGGRVLTEDESKAAFNSEAGIKATQYFVDLYSKHKVVSPGAISYEHDGVITAMQQGKAAMALTYSPNFLPMNDPEKSKVSGELAVSSTIPYDVESGLNTGITEVSGWGFGVAKMSKQKDAARKFIEFVTSDEEQLRLALEHTNAPTSKAVYNNSQYLKDFPSAPEVAKALESAWTRPGVEKWTNIEDILAAELSSAINGIKTVEQALIDAESQINPLLK